MQSILPRTQLEHGCLLSHLTYSVESKLVCTMLNAYTDGVPCVSGM
jgi:hypothetical protein